MTAADAARVRYPEDLPMLAADPRVRVLGTLNVDTLDGCVVCGENGWPTTRATLLITHRYELGSLLREVSVCGRDHADLALETLLTPSVDTLPEGTSITLHVPASWLAPDWSVPVVLAQGRDRDGRGFRVQCHHELISDETQVVVFVDGRAVLTFREDSAELRALDAGLLVGAGITPRGRTTA